MRLIDVNVLKEWVENWFTKNRFYHPYAKNNNIPITELYDILEQMPTIEERKKGKWIETDDGWDGTYYVCSECGCPWTLIDGSPEDNGMNYCPNCGADMRGEGNG